MKVTVRNDTNAAGTPSIEEMLYGPPQHAEQRTAPERTIYGVPQHETNVVDDPESQRPPAFQARREAKRRRDRRRLDRPRFTPRQSTEVTYP